MKAVVFYQRSAVSIEKIMEVYPRHKALADAFAKTGSVIAIGAFADIFENKAADAISSMGIFRDRQAAEDFVKQDPFVLEGIAANVTIREWNEVLLP
jgi:uncharacterized protein YciI